jgi:hypothetical protein
MPMPKPRGKETKEDFVARFMGDEAMAADYPDEKQRAAVAYKTWGEPGNKMPDLEKDENGHEIAFTYCKDCDESISIKSKKKHESDGHKVEVVYKNERTNDRGQKGVSVDMKFIEPGLVQYEDVGMVLVKKEALDRMAKTAKGIPIFNKQHKEVTNSDFSDGRSDGIVSSDPFFNASDAWYHTDTLVWDPETISDIRGGTQLSCAYEVTEWGPGGIHNNIPYEREVVNGRYTHIAMVDDPRYEGAQAIFNDKGGIMLFKLFGKKDDKGNQKISDLEAEKVTAKIGDEEVPMSKLIDVYNSMKKKENEVPAMVDDDEVEVNNEKVSVKDLKAGYLKNKSDEDMKDDHKDGKHDDKEMENCPMCNARKNAEDDEKKKKEEDEKKDRENAKRRQNMSDFDRVANDRQNKGDDEIFNAADIGLLTETDRLEAGHRMFGRDPLKKETADKK